MDYDILLRPSYAMAQVKLETSERIQAETGAMISMSSGIRMSTGVRGGMMKSLRRSVLGRESFFINTFEAERPGEVTLAPPLPGDIEALELEGNTVMVQSESFLAASGDIEVDSQWGGAKAFFAREGLFMLRCSGRGLMFVSSYGGIYRIDLAAGEEYSVDNGHMVAFDQSVKYSIGRSGGWKTTVLGGEGLVCKLTGPGRFYLQTRSEDDLLAWLTPKIESSKQR